MNKSELFFADLSDEDMKQFGADMATAQRTRIGDGPSRRAEPEVVGAKHRVHYGIIGSEETYKAFTSSQAPKADHPEYAEWCEDIAETLAEVHEVEPKDIVLTLVWNL